MTDQTSYNQNRPHASHSSLITVPNRFNENHIRDQEKRYIEELAELISSSVSDMSTFSTKLDKGAILQEATTQARGINQDDSHEAVQQSQVSSSKPSLSQSILPEEILGPLLLEALDGFVFVVNSQGRVGYASDNITDYLSYSKDELVGKSIYNIIHVEDHAQFSGSLILGSQGQRAAGASYVKGRNYTVRMLIKSPSGSNYDTSKQTPQYEDMVVTPFVQPQMSSTNPSTSTSENESCLVYLAQRLPAEEKRMMGMENFTTKQDLTGTIFDFDVSGIMMGQIRPQLQGLKLVDICNTNDVQHITKHLKEVVKDGENTSQVYRLKLHEKRHVFVRTKSMLKRNPNLNRQAEVYILSNHSVIRDCDSELELKGSASTSLMKSVIGHKDSVVSLASPDLLGMYTSMNSFLSSNSPSINNMPGLAAPLYGSSIAPLNLANINIGSHSGMLNSYNVLSSVKDAPMMGPRRVVGQSSTSLGQTSTSISASSATTLRSSTSLAASSYNVCSAYSDNLHDMLSLLPTASSSWLLNTGDTVGGVTTVNSTVAGASIAITTATHNATAHTSWTPATSLKMSEMTFQKHNSGSMRRASSAKRPPPLNLHGRSHAFDAGQSSPLLQSSLSSLQRSPGFTLPCPRGPNSQRSSASQTASRTSAPSRNRSPMMSPQSSGLSSYNWCRITGGRNNPDIMNISPGVTPPLQALQSMDNMSVYPSTNTSYPALKYLNDQRTDKKVKSSHKLTQLLIQDTSPTNESSIKILEELSNKSTEDHWSHKSPKSTRQSPHPGHSPPQSTTLNDDTATKSTKDENVILKQLLSSEEDADYVGLTNVLSTNVKERTSTHDSYDTERNEAEPKKMIANNNVLLKKLLRENENEGPQNPEMYHLLQLDLDIRVSNSSSSLVGSTSSDREADASKPPSTNERKRNTSGQQLPSSTQTGLSTPVTPHTPTILTPARTPTPRSDTDVFSTRMDMTSETLIRQFTNMESYDSIPNRFNRRSGGMPDVSVVTQGYPQLDSILNKLWEKGNNNIQDNDATPQKKRRKASGEVDSTESIDRELVSPNMGISQISSSTNLTISPSELCQKNVLLHQLLSKKSKPEKVVNTSNITVNPSGLPQSKLPNSQLLLKRMFRVSDNQTRDIVTSTASQDILKLDPVSPYQVPVTSINRTLEMFNLMPTQQQTIDSVTNILNGNLDSQQMTSGSSKSLFTEVKEGNSDPLLEQILQQVQDLQNDINIGTIHPTLNESLNRLTPQQQLEPKRNSLATFVSQLPNQETAINTDLTAEETSLLAQFEKVLETSDINLNLDSVFDFMSNNNHSSITHDTGGPMSQSEQMVIDAIQQQLMSDDPQALNASSNMSQSIAQSQYNRLQSQQPAQMSNLDIAYQLNQQQQQQQQQMATFHNRLGPRLPQPQGSMPSTLDTTVVAGQQQQQAYFTAGNMPVSRQVRHSLIQQQRQKQLKEQEKRERIQQQQRMFAQRQQNVLAAAAVTQFNAGQFNLSSGAASQFNRLSSAASTNQFNPTSAAIAGVSQFSLTSAAPVNQFNPSTSSQFNIRFQGPQTLDNSTNVPTFPENLAEMMKTGKAPNVTLRRNQAIPGPMSPTFNPALHSPPQQKAQRMGVHQQVGVTQQISPQYPPTQQQQQWRLRGPSPALQNSTLQQRQRSLSGTPMSSGATKRYGYPDVPFSKSIYNQPPSQNQQIFATQTSRMPRQISLPGDMRNQGRMLAMSSPTSLLLTPQNISPTPTVMRPSPNMNPPSYSPGVPPQITQQPPSGMNPPSYSPGLPPQQVMNSTLLQPSPNYTQPMLSPQEIDLTFYNQTDKSLSSVSPDMMGNPVTSTSQFVKQELRNKCNARSEKLQQQQHQIVQQQLGMVQSQQMMGVMLRNTTRQQMLNAVPSFTSLDVDVGEIPLEILNTIEQMTAEQMTPTGTIDMPSDDPFVKVENEAREESHRRVEQFRRLDAPTSVTLPIGNSTGTSSRVFCNMITGRTAEVIVMNSGRSTSSVPTTSAESPVNIVHKDERIPVKDMEPPDQKNSLLQQLLSE